ncbi:Aminopeptidase S [Luteitalea pratensis]|uniref:Aminopeptidase S n=1 Tax=Luteitalea pratensis TaxID=1855912 RepID=A0A143PH54_LUTPR|nr:M28 family metallopeptidase [Luteitalea pratensis]AMY07094.1 Aminopeptidase S [Luteitalea pratensis]
MCYSLPGSRATSTVALASLALLIAGLARPQTPAPSAAWSATSPAATRWFSHVEMLAKDEMRGRETGSPEHRQAADYIAAQFKAAGLAAGTRAGYLQPVSFTSRRLLEKESSLALVTKGAAVPVTLGEQAIFGMRIDPAATVEAPLVFAGYGLQVPETGMDDFAGLDVKGKVVVYLVGSPAGVPGALSAHYQSAWVRAETLRRLGAIGLISIPNPQATDVPWERSSANRLAPAMALADASLGDSAGQQLSVTFNPAHADLLFAASGHTFAELLALAGNRQPLPHFALPTSVRAHVAVEKRAVESQNVVGLLRGSDPTLANEYVVLSAHLDHLGVGAAVNGDAIYNGAMDNASGIATLIEAASAIVAAKPKRSVLFVAVTGEEKGLLGSRYFARNPTVPRGSIVADINMDMFLPLYPLRQLMVLGLDESDLGDDVRAVAAAVGIGVQVDPQPLRNRFTRSDQYSFIREGVPALAMKVGAEPDSPEAAIEAAWTKDRYHAPSDDLQQPIDRAAAVGFTEVVGRLAVQVANRPTRPAWKPASFFRRFAGTR